MGSLHEQSFLEKPEVPVMIASRMMPRILLLFSAALLVLAGCRKTDVDEEGVPTEPVRHAQKLRPPLEYRSVEGTSGALRQAVLFSQSVPALASELEVSSMSLLPREVSFPADRETLLEVRAGEVTTIDGNDRKDHPTGDMWLVRKGSQLKVKAKGEIAVLRSISLSAKPSR
jgi:hypothetical protein